MFKEANRKSQSCKFWASCGRKPKSFDEDLETEGGVKRLEGSLDPLRPFKLVPASSAVEHSRSTNFRCLTFSVTGQFSQKTTHLKKAGS